MKLFKTFSGSFKLERLPKTTKGDLRAWDAADELLLQAVYEIGLSNNSPPILVINDAFGALTTGLHPYTVHNWSDSYLSHLAIEENIQLNKLDSQYQLIPSSDDLAHQYDLVILKIPKTLALLEDQLCRLKPHITEQTTVIAAAMSKHIHTSTLKLFEKHIGSTNTSRATKKARLIFAHNDNKKTTPSPYPKTIRVDEYDLALINHANVFSKDHLDIGSRFFIEQLKHCPESNRIIDLGCGNGALGIMMQRLQPQAAISFVDESYMAVKSAKESYQLENTKNTSKAVFYVSDCLSQYTEEKAQLILCNPPFHQAHSIGDHIAWKMFQQSFDQLERAGELWVIGNRHLAYHAKLKRLFGNCRTVASNKKFVVLVAKKG